MATQAGDNPEEIPDVGRTTAPGHELTTTPVDQRKDQYLVALRTVPGFMPMSADSLHASLRNIEGVEVIKRIRPRGFGVMSANGTTSVPEILVTKMDAEKGALLQAQAQANPNYIVEPDLKLIHVDALQDFMPQFAAPTGPAIDLDFQVLGVDNVPLSSAMVQVYGTALPSQGTTDANGRVTLSVFGNVVRAVYVKPAANYWERMVVDPQISLNGPNRIVLRPLTETWPGFPDKAVVGWGQKEMQLDRMNPALTGNGVKIAIIDSGCDTTHPQLRHIQMGVDFTAGGDPNSWRRDELSHGTHCAGIIGAASDDARGIRGFAPGAEIHAFKVFPGGRSSDLIDALDQCIDLGIDVVNMSLGTDNPSELVAQKIIEAGNKGVACIVAAGNSGGGVQFPGSLPSVLTVSAVGETNTFPPDSAHAMTPLPGGIGDLFPAKFSCFGPQVDVTAPGVAILSCVPGGYAAWDGTSMATPHVTGLAALVLAHHPAFQGKKMENAQRVQQLFDILKRASAPCVVDVNRGGAGLPNAIAAVGQVAGAGPFVTAGSEPSQGATAAPAGFTGSNIPADQQQLLSAVVYYRAVMQLRAAGLV